MELVNYREYYNVQMENADILYMVNTIRHMIIKNVPKPGFDKGKVSVLWGTPGQKEYDISTNTKGFS